MPFFGFMTTSCPVKSTMEKNDDREIGKASMTLRRKLIAFASLCVVASTALGVALPGFAQSAERMVPGSPGEVMFSFAPLVREASPAVVNIFTKSIVAGRTFDGRKVEAAYALKFHQTLPMLQARHATLDCRMRKLKMHHLHRRRQHQYRSLVTTRSNYP